MVMARDRVMRAFRNPAEDDLPERVKLAIRNQQDASEIVIGWIQLAVVTMFAVLYTVSPKTFSSDAGIEPVPWALAAYFLFTVIRLWAGYRSHLPHWLLALSVVVDMSLLLGTIWSFHIQYSQPPSFYLKVPTLLYVFIFIALRALRFEARYVILAGVVAALGWSFMAFYAAYAGAAEGMITRDYVYYMTSNSILIGAEFDKVITILVVTGILAVALVRARQLLVRAVTEGTAVKDLSRFFAPEIARQITASEHQVTAGEGIARDAAILMVDVRGFTGLAARLPANELISILAAYQARMVTVIQRHHGSIDKFMGDGIMATFGAAVDSDCYAADALRAVDEIMEEAQAWGRERERDGEVALRIGAAVATGRIIFGAVGDETRLEYTVIGDAVNMTAKLEKHTKEEKVRALATEQAYETACAQGYEPPLPVERLRGRQLMGVGGTSDLVVLVK